MLIIKYKGLTAKQTCEACPEQYNVFNEEGNQVAYFRLRWGHFRVDTPDCGGETIYECDTKGNGCFEDSNERKNTIIKAFEAVLQNDYIEIENEEG